MDSKQQKRFLAAMEEMVEEKGISKEIIVDAISEAFKVAYNKKLSDELLIVQKPLKLKKVKKIKDEDGNVVSSENSKLEDALIRCDISLEKGKILTYRQWKVVKDEDLVDDFVEISEDDERAKSNKLKVGDFYEEPLSFDDFSKGDVNRFISAYRAKINQAEKESLLQSFSGKIGELISGTVEKSDGHSVLVNLGRISITLYQKDLIGKETFKPGDTIKMYVCGISKDDTKGGSLIHCSRSCPEYLAKIFADEVHEIYDGTVKIAKIARIAGIRSKVAVYSEDPNVDAQGACIGQNGNRIQAVVANLGNDRFSKEKIDVIQYSPITGILLREALRPGVVIGIHMEETTDGKKVATAVCENETGSAAIGVKGTNVVLARQLCGLSELIVIDQKVAEERNLDFEPMAVFEEQAHEIEKEQFRITSMKNAELNANKPIIEEVKAVVGDDELLDKELDLEAEAEYAKIKAEKEKEPVIEEKSVEESPIIKEESKEVKSESVEKVSEHEETKLEPVKLKSEKKVSKNVDLKPQEVKTTTTLDALEASLEKEKQNEKQHDSKFKKDKKSVHKEKEDIEDIKPIIDESNKMSIYTDEELAEMEDEFEDYDEDLEEDEDYSEYDSDEYYSK